MPHVHPMAILVGIVAAFLLFGIVENRWRYRKLMRGKLFVHYDSQDRSGPGPRSASKRVDSEKSVAVAAERVA